MSGSLLVPEVTGVPIVATVPRVGGPCCVRASGRETRKCAGELSG
ncbi:MAG: hypothetical protein ACYTJ0_06075 [Planctomycetota bacterium]